MNSRDCIKVRVEQISSGDESEVIIRCHKLSPRLKQVIALLKDENLRLVAYEGDRVFQLAPTDIFYIESVDKRTFFYGESKVYESKTRLYELETTLADFDFFRVSKSMLINLGKVQSFAPSSSRRFEAIMQNGEKVLISRHYVGKLKRLLNER